jgi:hypothetical protein
MNIKIAAPRFLKKEALRLQHIGHVKCGHPLVGIKSHIAKTTHIQEGPLGAIRGFPTRRLPPVTKPQGARFPHDRHIVPLHRLDTQPRIFSTRINVGASEERETDKPGSVNYKTSFYVMYKSAFRQMAKSTRRMEELAFG